MKNLLKSVSCGDVRALNLANAILDVDENYIELLSVMESQGLSGRYLVDLWYNFYMCDTKFFAHCLYGADRLVIYKIAMVMRGGGKLQDKIKDMLDLNLTGYGLYKYINDIAYEKWRGI